MTNTTTPPTTEPTDLHDMVVVHRVFRREVPSLAALVRSTAAGDTARAATVAGHARLVLRGLHLHHTGEDDLLWPLLDERATPSVALVRRMRDQHAVVEDLLTRLGPAVDRWEAEARPAVAGEVADLFDALHVAVVEHLDDEEREILPLAAVTITPAEWEAVGRAGIEKMSRSDLPLMFGCVLEDADAAERREMLHNLLLPVRVLMRTWGARHYRRYITTVRAGARAR